METKRIAKIMKYYNRVGVDSFPVSLQVSLTDSCYNKCSFCDHWKREGNKINSDKWISFLKDAKTKGLESVCYIGGDGFAYPDINKVLEAHLALGISYGFVTTGFAPDYINRDLLKQARWIRCSLDAIKDIDYKLYRGGISANKVIKCIIELNDIGCNIELQPTPANDRIKEEIIKFANRHDIKISAMSSELIIENVPIRKYNFNKCNAVYYQLYIDSIGDVYPCCHLAGDIYDHSIIEPFGNIFEDNWLENRKLFSELDSFERPDHCKVCGERFQSINNVIENVNKRGEFF